MTERVTTQNLNRAAQVLACQPSAESLRQALMEKFSTATKTPIRNYEDLVQDLILGNCHLERVEDAIVVINRYVSIQLNNGEKVVEKADAYESASDVAAYVANELGIPAESLVKTEERFNQNQVAKKYFFITTMTRSYLYKQVEQQSN